MKIDGKVTSPLTGEVVPENRPGPVRPAGGAAEDGTPRPSVDVQVSSLAAQLQALEAKLVSGESIDAAKVAEIRQAIAEGRLQINPDVIADRLLETVRELIRGAPSS